MPAAELVKILCNLNKKATSLSAFNLPELAGQTVNRVHHFE